MRSPLTRTQAGRPAAAPAPAAGPEAAVVGMLRRSGAALVDQPRRPPLALGRRLRGPAGAAVPAESRIVFRAGAVAWR
jgi:hypothetical protein